MADIPQTISSPSSSAPVSVAPAVNELNIFFNQAQFNIIKTYKKLHRLLFKHGVFALMGILAIGVVYYLSQQAIKENLSLSQTSGLSLAKSFREKQLSQLENADLQVQIPYGESETKEGVISTRSNLATYQGVVLPRVFSLPQGSLLFDLERFAAKQTTSGELMKVIEQLIFSPLLQTTNLPFSPTLTLSDGILTDFNLQCINEQKLSPILCDKFLERFYAEGTFYNIGTDKTSMETLLKSIKDTEQLCTLMYDTTLYHRMVYPAFNDLILQCSTSHIQRYRELINFIEVEEELSKGIISLTIYSNKSINAYKLLSAQQILYKSLLAGALNRSTISSYLEYAQELINRNNGNDRYISPLYKDILYRINNGILLPLLETNDNKTISKMEIQQLINQINQLNKGNSALGVVGLEKQLTTAGLIPQREVGAITITNKDIEELLKPILDMKDRLKIQSYQISEERDTVVLQTEIFSTKILEALEMNLRARVVLYTERDTLYVQSITILNEADVNAFVQHYISTAKISFIQLLNILDENIALYQADVSEARTLCEMMESMYSNILVNCTPTVIELSQKGVDYSFQIENEVLGEVTISDPTLEADIKAMLQNSLINSTTTYSLMQDILNTQLATPEEKYIGEKLIINERMRLYLNASPIINILEGPVFEVVFTLGEFTLKGTYDVETNTISRIYYVIPMTQETLLIRNFVLPINEANKENLAYFSNNPKTYLRVSNTTAFTKYEAMLQKQKE
jgi:hypothetical protein